MFGWPAVTNSGACCCDVGAIGFDLTAWPGVTFNFPGISTVINLASNVSRLGECRIVFAGLNNACGDAIHFSSGDWPAVKTYLQNGGRLWLQTEHGGCFSSPAWQSRLASFLSALGSSITWLGGSYDGTCSNPPCVAGSANIALGSSLLCAATGEIGGGVATVWKSPTAHKNMVQVDRIGSGFLFVTGDSNLFDFGLGGCGFSNHDFALRLYNYENSLII